MQLGLLYSGLGLEEPIDDIVEDVPITRILLNEFTKPNQVVGVHIPKLFVVEVQDAIRF